MNAEKPFAFVLGTRPEVIKLAPLIEQLRVQGRPTVLIATGQHDRLARQAFEVFGLKPAVDLQLMKADQTPVSFLGRLLPVLEETLERLSPRGVVVQGDTTTALGGALASFHLRIPVAHVEAGLRTHDFGTPFPEEMNRVLISRIAALHFAPTETAATNLRREGVERGVTIVGNTVVDAVLAMAQRIDEGRAKVDLEVERMISSAKKLLLVTSHRRDNFGKPLSALCQTLLKLVQKESDLEIVFPVHLNPNVRDAVHQQLGTQERIHLIEPVDYPSLVQLIRKSSLIISDSGGIQEEAPSFGTPLIVVRTSSERPEGIAAGTSLLRTLEEPELLFASACELLRGNKSARKCNNPFGDGKASIRIAQTLMSEWA